MSSAFGTDFIIVNDVQQVFPPKVFRNGPWLHIATVVRGFKEYCCFKHVPSDKVYIEEVDPTSQTLFKQIADHNEWNDLRSFLEQKGILAYAVNKEMKIAKQKK